MLCPATDLPVDEQYHILDDDNMWSRVSTEELCCVKYRSSIVAIGLYVT